MYRRKRCFREIAAEILKALVERPMKLTEIALHVGIPTDRCRRMMDFLAARRLVSAKGRLYHATARGIRWLSQFESLQALCCGVPKD